MRPDIAARPPRSSAAQPARPPRPPRPPWKAAEPVILTWDEDKFSAAQPPCAAPRPSKEFLAALEEAGYQREDDGRALLRELVNSLSSGKLLLVPTDDVWHLDEEKREDFAIAKLDQLIELVVRIRTAWIASPESEHAREVAGRRLGPLEGQMSEHEARAATD